MPCQRPPHSSHIADCRPPVYEFCHQSDPDVGLPILVCDVEHTYFHVSLSSRKFVLCLFGQCPAGSLHHMT